MTKPGVQVVWQLDCGALHGMPAYHQTNYCSGREKRRALPIFGHTYACTLPSA
jgi:hypothetical protein